MPKPKNLTITDQDGQIATNDSSPTPSDPSPKSQNPSETLENSTFIDQPPFFKLRSYEALMNQIPRFSVDVDMSEDTTEMGLDENLDNYEFSSDDDDTNSLMTDEMKLLRQSRRLQRNRDSNRLSTTLNAVGRNSSASQDSNELLLTPRSRHGGLILKKENASLVNNLKEKMDILKGLIEHESEYLFNLDLLKDKFIGTLKRSELITPEEMEKLFCFSQLNIIWNVNTELLNQFNVFYTTLDHINEQNTIVSPRASSIGQIFLRLTPFLKNYIQYSNQLDTCFIAIKNKQLKDSYFKSIVKKLDKMCCKLAFAQNPDGSFSFLQAMKIPLKQFVHYRKALLDLLNISHSSPEECNILNESLKLIEIVSHTFEQILNEMKNREKFYDLNKKILKQSENGEILTIIKPNRVFVNEIEVYMTSSNNNHLEIRKKKKKQKDNNANAISVTKIDIPNENFFQDEKNKLVAFHFNDSIVMCTSTFETPKPPRNANKETAAKRKRLKQVNSILEAKKLRFKESIDLESDPVPWVRNIISNDLPTISSYDSTSGEETISKFPKDLSYMFQLVTWNKIYTFKFHNETTKNQWIQSIQKSLTEIKVSRKQDLDYPHAKSGGYVEIPQSWVLPSVLAIQSYIRSYLIVQKTLRIKKKSRKGNRARLSVIQRINQQENKLLQNQAFTQNYPKKEAITLLKDYEEDENDTYIVVEEEEEELKHHQKPNESKNVQQQAAEKETQIGLENNEHDNMEEEEESEEEDPVSIPIHATPPELSVETSEEKKEIPIQSNDISQPTQVYNNPEPTEPAQDEISPISKSEIKEETNEEVEEISPIPLPETRKEMVDEIIYEDENGDQFYVRVGDEIVYVDENGNQVVEIVTPEKFLEIVNAADMMEEEEEEEMANQAYNRASQSVPYEPINKVESNINEPPQKTIEKQVETIIEEVAILQTPNIEKEPLVLTTVPNTEINPPVQVPQEVHTISQPTGVQQTQIPEETAHNITSSISESETKSAQPEEPASTIPSNPPPQKQVTEPVQPPAEDLNKQKSNTSTQSKPSIPLLDTFDRRTSESSTSSSTNSEHYTPSMTPRRSIAMDSPRKPKEEEIAPWQKELLSKYKNDGKFKFVTQTAEEKIARASFSEDAQVIEHAGLDIAPLQPTINSAQTEPVSNRELNRQSIRISSDFQNFLKKFKTIEQKASEEK